VTITTADMTRFLLTLDDAVDTIFAAVSAAARGETYIPRCPSARMTDLAAFLIGDRDVETVITGIRPGEKIHEILLSEEEPRAPCTAARATSPCGRCCPSWPAREEPALVGDYSSASALYERRRARPLPRGQGPRGLRRALPGGVGGHRRHAARHAPRDHRLSRVIEVLDRSCRHVLVHTGQNFEDRLSGMFFRELGVREPDVAMGVRGAGFADQIGQILKRSEEVFRAERPDTVLILGDTNTGVAAFVARRMGIRVAHMEAGNRCYDDRVPEEVNRRVIDHCSSVLMPYTHRSAANLVREGIERHRVYVTGNPIKEVLDHYAPRIELADPFTAFGVEPGRYFLVTAHRAETVDVPERLAALVEALDQVRTNTGCRSSRRCTRARPTGCAATVCRPRRSRSPRPWGCSTSCASRRRRSACSPTAAPCRRSAASSGCPR